MNRFEDTFNTQVMASPEGAAATHANTKTNQNQSHREQDPAIDISKGLTEIESMIKINH